MKSSAGPPPLINSNMNHYSMISPGIHLLTLFNSLNTLKRIGLKRTGSKGTGFRRIGLKRIRLKRIRLKRIGVEPAW